MNDFDGYCMTCGSIHLTSVNACVAKVPVTDAQPSQKGVMPNAESTRHRKSDPTGGAPSRKLTSAEAKPAKP
jgi:hypothetical protein